MTAKLSTNVRVAPTQIRYLAHGELINRRFVSQGIEVNTGRYEDFHCDIHDGRTISDQFDLDVHGFELVNHQTSIKDFHDKDEVDAKYLDETSEAIKQITGADKVISQGWMIRTSADISSSVQKVENYVHAGGVQPPAGEAHVDYDSKTARMVAERTYKQHFPDGPGFKRFLATSYWRTFSAPPQDVPLSVCDFRSVADSEGFRNALVVVDEIPSKTERLAPLDGEEDMIAAYIFNHNPSHKWWYFSNMTKDEVLLFKFHDSDHSRAWRCPHSAFIDGSIPDANIRASIEVRSMSFFEK